MFSRCFQLAALSALLFLAPLQAGAEFCALDDAADPVLQAGLERVLQAEGLDGAVRKGQLAVSLLVLSDPERPRLAEVNGHRMMYAASLPKITILLGAAVELERGRLQLTPSLEQDIHSMIRFSCNDCSNRVLDQVGRENLLDILQSPRFGLYDPDSGGGLWMGKDYGPNPAFHRDPLAGLSHGASTFQVARFYCGLQRGEIVGPQALRLMREAMVEPGIRHKFVSGLYGHRGEVTMYRKSGTWRDFHADSVLVEGEGQAYVLVALAHSDRGSRWLQHMADPMHHLATSDPANPIATAHRTASLSPSAGR